MKSKKQPYQPDPAKKLEQAKLYASWRADHEHELAEYAKEFVLTAQGKNAAYAAKHRAKQLNALPAWADLTAIDKFYVEAAATGLHVDHIYPLRGETVCGLHVPLNLHLLSPLENLRKGNRIQLAPPDSSATVVTKTS